MTQWTGASLSGKYQATPSTLTDGTQTQLLTDNKGAVVLGPGTNTVGNVKLTDGTNTASVDASGNQKVNLTTSLPAGTATIGSVQVTDGTRTATIDATTNAIRTYAVNTATSVTSTSQVLAPDEPTVGLGTVQPLATDNHRRLILSPTVGGRPNVWRQGHATLAANTLTSLTNATAVPTLTPAAPAQAIEYTVPVNVSSRLVQAYLVLDNPPNNVTVTMTLTFGLNQTRIACSSGTNYIWNRQFLAAPSLSAGQAITIQLLATSLCNVGVFLEIAEDVA